VQARRANRVVSLGELVDAVWGDQPSANTGTACLRRPPRRGAGCGQALGLCRGQPFAGPPGPFAEAERLRLTELATLAA